ncbi:13490_t:CDS:1, partial [Dentiscutata heterogama]
KEFVLATDILYLGFEATLNQISSDQKEHPIAYTSKSLKKEEINYRATKIEYVAIVWAI